MTSDLRIFEIAQTEGYRAIYTQVMDNMSIDYETVDFIIDECNKSWHLEGECGFVGEITGAKLGELLNIPDITHQLEEEEVYRIEISW